MNWPPRGTYRGGPAALRAREKSTAAKWGRVQFRDNREPATRKLALGGGDGPRETAGLMLPAGFWEEVGERAAWALFLESCTARGQRLHAISKRAAAAGVTP